MTASGEAAEIARRVISSDDEMVLIGGIGFLKGFLDMLIGVSNADDGLENLDPGGFLSITSEAREKLKTVEAVFDRLNV